MGTAVNIRGLLKRHGHIAFDKPMEHEHRHRHRESGMHKYQSKPVVQYIQRSAVDTDKRDHDRLERNDHGRYHKGKCKLRDPVIVTNNIVCKHCRKQRHKYRCRYGHKQRILKSIDEIHLCKCLNKIIKGQSLYSEQP